MSQYSIEDMPSQLLKRRIKEGWKVYKDLCSVLGKKSSGKRSDPKTWKTYPEIEQFIDVVSFAKIVLEIRKKGKKKVKKLLEEKIKREQAIKLGKKRKKKIKKLWKKKESFSIKKGMKQLQFQSRENFIKYLLFCPYDFFISDSKISVENKKNRGEKILEEEEKERIWEKRDNIAKNFKNLIEIPQCSNEFAMKQWKKFEEKLELSKNKI